MRIKVTGMAAALAILGLVAVWQFWPDAQLDPAIVHLQQHKQARLPAADNLFNALSGFAVAADKDPVAEGYAAVTRVNALLRTEHPEDRESFNASVAAAWVPSELALDDPDKILCTPLDADCIAALAAGADAVLALSQVNATLVDRYRGLSAYPEFANEVIPHLSMPLPQLSLVMEAHRVALAGWLVRYLDGADAALAELVDDLAFLRRYLAQADVLIDKMVAAGMAAEDLHVLAALMDRGDTAPQQPMSIAGLDDEELTLAHAIEAEFLFVTQGLATLEQHPEWLADIGVPVWAAKFGMRPLFKPKRTLNLIYACFQRARAMAAAPAAQFYRQWTLAGSEPEPCAHAWSDWLINPIGVVLLQIGGPNFGRYQTRLHELNGLVSLVALKRAIRVGGIPADEIPAFLTQGGATFGDPYNAAPMKWSAQEAVLYFDSPKGGDRYNRLPLNPLSRPP